MFEDAAKLVVMTQQGSTPLIQRKLKLGYNREAVSWTSWRAPVSLWLSRAAKRAG